MYKPNDKNKTPDLIIFDLPNHMDELDTNLRMVKKNYALCKSLEISDLGVEMIRAESGMILIASSEIVDKIGTEEAKKKLSMIESFISKMSEVSFMRESTELDRLLREKIDNENKGS